MALFVTNAIKTKRAKMALLCFGQTQEKVGPLGDDPNRTRIYAASMETDKTSPGRQRMETVMGRQHTAQSSMRSRSPSVVGTWMAKASPHCGQATTMSSSRLMG
jgi:hypothetical protein